MDQSPHGEADPIGDEAANSVEDAANQLALTHCSFCKKEQGPGVDLVRGPSVAICDACVELSLEILIEADLFSRARLVPLVFKRRGTNKGATTRV